MLSRKLRVVGTALDGVAPGALVAEETPGGGRQQNLDGFLEVVDASTQIAGTKRPREP